MNNHLFTKKTGKIILKNRMLRTLSLLCAVFVLFSIIFLFMFFSYRQKIADNDIKIEQAQQTLANLQYLATLEKQGVGDTIETSLFAKKSFVGYEEVIPFIAMLESLFTMIDPKAEITIRSEEEQIFTDHFADYYVHLKIDDKKELFFKALDELYNSRFVTKITDFNMQYKAAEDSDKNEFSEIEFIIRLYLN
jgi:hypothetical protein